MRAVQFANVPRERLGEGDAMNQLLSGILDEKGHDVLRIDADASVFEAVKRMVEANVGLAARDGERRDHGDRH